MNEGVFRRMFLKTVSEGKFSSPRGLRIVELEDFAITVRPENPFFGFPKRNYDVEYFKKEMLWKLGANKYDGSIKQHAKMWESVQNPDGTFNSNYGQYWFGEQQGFWNVVQELVRDEDSRRAVIPMLSKEHMTPQTVDTVCTLAVGFRIRDGALHMSAYMRSSDQIFGLGTDIPTFAFLYRLVYTALLNTYDLRKGDITIVAMSSHIYERHFQMVEDIVQDQSYVEVDMPWPVNMAEVLFLTATRGKYTRAPDEFGLSNWLVTK
jgi:thymidylate synthase